MAMFINNISDAFDFRSIIEKIKDAPGHEELDYLFKDLDKYRSLETKPEDYDWAYPLYEAGYKEPIWNGVGYSPGVDFTADFIPILDKMFGTICTQCWINKLPPGKLAYAHKDRDGREKELLKLGSLVRYSIHLGDPDPGHVFWLEGKCHYMEEHGSTYLWDDYLSLHGGSNTGYTNKYIMIYRGLIPHKNFEFDYVWTEGTGYGAYDDVRLRLKDGRIV